jgi:hypothetical protein
LAGTYVAPTPANHQPPEVNLIEVLAKVDFPCRAHLRMYLLLDFTKSENGRIVHFWWLVNAFSSGRGRV